MNQSITTTKNRATKPGSIKPNTTEAMRSLLSEIRRCIPLDLPEASLCGGKCLGCSKKMLEMLDTEVCFWESRLDDEVPGLADLKSLQRLAERTHKILKRNQLV
ncbi:Uncharacterised protein [Shewanella algae]|uniref:Uncharacterized protein n=4 Tax=Bacteria TaxID=2 RepID=A0A380BJR9_9GAMM|nr:Uncharacterised protein [Shewanella algae]